MEEKINYRKELEEARKAASKIELRGHDNEIDAYWEVICGLVLVAEEDLHEQDREWEIASLARELLTYAYPLEGYDHMLNKLREAVKRITACISDHPRLKAQLLQFHILLLERIEVQQDHQLRITEDLRDELQQLKKNIALADEGRLDDIPQTGHLKRDPVEWTARWEEIIDQADRKVYAQLRATPRGMGFCHAFWHARMGILSKDYGLEWRSPAMMNPRVLFD